MVQTKIQSRSNQCSRKDYRSKLSERRRNVGKRLAYTHWQLEVGLWLLFTFSELGRPVYAVVTKEKTYFIMHVFDTNVYKVIVFTDDWQDFSLYIRKAWK